MGTDFWHPPCPQIRKMSQISFEDSFWVMEQSDYDEFLLFRPLDFLKIYFHFHRKLWFLKSHHHHPSGPHSNNTITKLNHKIKLIYILTKLVVDYMSSGGTF